MTLHANSVYIILLYLRTTNGEHKYHWELLLTGRSPPSGIAYHATDAGRDALDLYRQAYSTRSGMLQSRTVVAALYVGQIGQEQLEWATGDSVTHLMSTRYLPRNEPRWTCRVWVKTVLEAAARQRYIQLPAGLDNIELCALATADRHTGTIGRAAVYNDFSWLRNTSRSYASSSAGRTTPMDIDSTGGGGRGGTTPMTGISYGSSSRRGGSKPMQDVQYHQRSGRR